MNAFVSSFSLKASTFRSSPTSLLSSKPSSIHTFVPSQSRLTNGSFPEHISSIKNCTEPHCAAAHNGDERTNFNHRQQNEQYSCRQFNTSRVSRRDVLVQTAGFLMGSMLTSVSLAKSSNAFSLNDLAISDSVSVIVKGKAKAEDLKKVVLKWGPKCSSDEKDVVLRSKAIWFVPAQLAGEKIAKLSIDNKTIDSEKVQVQSLMIKGHLLELSMEANNLSSSGIVRELEEFIETAELIIGLIP